MHRRVAGGGRPAPSGRGCWNSIPGFAGNSVARPPEVETNLQLQDARGRPPVAPLISKGRVPRAPPDAVSARETASSLPCKTLLQVQQSFAGADSSLPHAAAENAASPRGESDSAAEEPEDEPQIAAAPAAVTRGIPKVSPLPAPSPLPLADDQPEQRRPLPPPGAISRSGCCRDAIVILPKIAPAARSRSASRCLRSFGRETSASGHTARPIHAGSRRTPSTPRGPRAPSISAPSTRTSGEARASPPPSATPRTTGPPERWPRQ